MKASIVALAALGLSVLASSSPATPQLRLASVQQQRPALRASHFYLDSATAAELRLANRDSQSKRLFPLVRLFGELPVRLEPIVVPAYGEVRVDLGQALGFDSTTDSAESWGTGERQGSLWGSIDLFGDLEGLAACSMSTSSDESLVTASHFKDVARASLESLWWRPTPETQVVFALQNTGQQAISVAASFATAGELHSAAPIEIGPFRTRLLTLADIAPEEARSATSGIAIFEVEQQLEVLQGEIFVTDQNVGFSLELEMTERESTTELQTTAVMFGSPDFDQGFPANLEFATHLLVGNPSPTEGLTVIPDFHAKDATGQPLSWSAPAIVVPPSSVRVVDVSDLAGTDLAEGYTTVRLRVAGSARHVVAEAVVVSSDAENPLRFSFAGHFRPTPRQQLIPTGDKDTYRAFAFDSFELDGNWNSHLVVSNPHQGPSSFRYFIEYQDGVNAEYASGVIDLRPRETFQVDLKEIRDRGLPDATGTLLPPDLERGHLWVVLLEGMIVPEAVVFDPVHGTCPDEGNNETIEINPDA